MKLQLDVAQSLKMCPPNYPEGVKFIKRVILNRNKVKFNKSIQIYRVQVNLTPHVNELKESYSVYGHLHDQPVSVVEVSKTNPKFYDGVAGHNRDEALEALDVETMIYDIVEFSSPRAKLEFAYKSNHHAPAAKSKDEDIINGLLKAHDEKMADLTVDQELKDFIDIIAADFDETAKKRLFRKYRAKKSKYESIQPYDGESANAKAEELGYPIKGDYSVENSDGEITDYGYVKDPGGYKTLLHDGFKTWLSKKCKIDINVTGYVKNPSPSNLESKRKSYVNELDDMEDFVYDVCSKMTGITIDEIKKRNKYPFKFRGFLPQNKTPDVNNGGLPVETGLVDQHGNSVD